MEDKDFELNPGEMEAANGGRNFDSMTPEKKETIRRYIVRAKRDGAEMEDFLSRYSKGTLSYDFIKAVWDIVKV